MTETPTELPFPPKTCLKKLKRMRETAPNKEVRDNLTKKIEELKKQIAENDG